MPDAFENAPDHPGLEDLDEIVVSERQLEQRLDELGREISRDYAGGELAVIAIINGAIVFVADLIRKLSIPARLDCVRVATYSADKRPLRRPEIIDKIRLELEGLDVLLIDDVLDTGETLAKIAKLIRRLEPASLRTCVLLNKEGARNNGFEADYVGFKIPEHFVVGYGLDFAERYRHLPCIGVLKPELQNPPEWA